MTNTGTLLDSNESDPSEDELDIIFEEKTIRWESIMNQQFDLVYYGKLNYSDIETMAPIERRFLYQRLVDTRKEENRIKEEAINKMKTRK